MIPTFTKARKGNKKAQFDLYKQLYVELMPICRRYTSCNDDAVELYNLGFYKVLKNGDKLSNIEAFLPWAKRIQYNTIFEEFRKNRNRNQLETMTDFSQWNGNEAAEDVTDAQYNYEELLLMVRQLPRVTQMVFNLFAIDGFSHEEIGDKLEISQGTSKWHVSEARKRLKQLLSKDNNRLNIISNG